MPFLFYFASLLGFTCFAEKLENMPNKLGNFKGVSLHESYQGYTWVAGPYLKGPASMDIDLKGRVFVSEARRMGKGVPDNRRVDWRIYEDYRLQTVEDRLDSYRRNQHRIPMEWYDRSRSGPSLCRYRWKWNPISTRFSMTVAGKLRTVLDCPACRR